ncbi:MAG: class I SAM-dependent methyltransferase [Sinomicrobium sp.]|nr:class I SAM-dependent methyltransferase [Sinomicrobium sp.]
MKVHEASFRDPSGYVYTDGGTVKRLILPPYFKQYQALTSGGLYRELIDKGALIPHEELEHTADAIIIQPAQLPFVTYPYEWSFSQYRHAALLTLKLQKLCLQRGFTLKDASAFNIAFYNGKPVFIDTLSFDFYTEGEPWRAYKQFITHFLGPLALARYHGAGFLKHISGYIDGIPVADISSLLPFKTRFHLFLYTHIHLLAKYESKYRAQTAANARIKKLSKKAQFNILDDLYHYIKKLNVPGGTEWGDYYDHIHYDDEAAGDKAATVAAWAAAIGADRIVDLGGNNGAIARKLPRDNALILVADNDTAAVDANYNRIIAGGEKHIIPVVCDVLNPAPAVGFNNTERASFLQRLRDFKPGLCLALALIHHITLSGNVPFLRSAAFFASFAGYLLIEFPEADDAQVQFLLNRKGDFKQHFNFYTTEAFEAAYGTFFSIVQQHRIKNTRRVLYLLKNKSEPC